LKGKIRKDVFWNKQYISSEIYRFPKGINGSREREGEEERERERKRQREIYPPKKCQEQNL
jgi:hypothetical protein